MKRQLLISLLLLNSWCQNQIPMPSLVQNYFRSTTLPKESLYWLKQNPWGLLPRGHYISKLDPDLQSPKFVVNTFFRSYSLNTIIAQSPYGSADPLSLIDRLGMFSLQYQGLQFLYTGNVVQSQWKSSLIAGPDEVKSMRYSAWDGVKQDYILLTVPFGKFHVGFDWFLNRWMAGNTGIDVPAEGSRSLRFGAHLGLENIFLQALSNPTQTGLDLVSLGLRKNINPKSAHPNYLIPSFDWKPNDEISNPFQKISLNLALDHRYYTLKWSTHPYYQREMNTWTKLLSGELHGGYQFLGASAGWSYTRLEDNQMHFGQKYLLRLVFPLQYFMPYGEVSWEQNWGEKILESPWLVNQGQTMFRFGFQCAF